MRTFLAVVLGIGTYLGCMATGWFNGVFGAFMATFVFVFASVFKGFKKKGKLVEKKLIKLLGMVLCSYQQCNLMVLWLFFFLH